MPAVFLSPDRLIFLTVLLGLAMLHFTWRNTTKHKAPPFIAVGFALAEIVVQGAILLGLLLLVNAAILTMFPPSRLLGFIVLVFTVVIAYKPVKAVSTYLESRLADMVKK